MYNCKSYNYVCTSSCKTAGNSISNLILLQLHAYTCGCKISHSISSLSYNYMCTKILKTNRYMCYQNDLHEYTRCNGATQTYLTPTMFVYAYCMQAMFVHTNYLLCM